jgi:hypothetical protein
VPLNAGWVWGCIYLAAYGGWAWFFRSNVDSWARRLLGGKLGVEVVWLPATTFPLEIWVWGLVGKGRSAGRSALESRVALGSTAMCLAGAFMPTAALCILLRWSPSLSERLGAALYLTTPPLILLFVASHLRWRASDPSGPEARRDRRERLRDKGRTPSEPPPPGSAPQGDP